MIEYLPQILSQSNITPKGVIHIGAHWGQEYPIYKHCKIPNLIFYEPLKENYKVLQTKVGPEVILRNVALGNFIGDIDMFVEVANQSMSCSILEPDIHLKQYPHITFPKKEKVKIITLNSEFLDTSKYNIINIDVQGYELEVFKGATQVLPTIDLIISEINRESLYKECAKVEDLDSFLSEYSFKRVLTEWEGGTWGNGVYIKV
jgi:FkbM family methyltransferase